MNIVLAKSRKLKKWRIIQGQLSALMSKEYKMQDQIFRFLLLKYQLEKNHGKEDTEQLFQVHNKVMRCNLSVIEN
jgi:hypothetical protein